MKTWQGLKHLEENFSIKQEDSYRFKAEANANKKYEGLLKEKNDYDVFSRLDDKISDAIQEFRSDLEIVLDDKNLLKTEIGQKFYRADRELDNAISKYSHIIFSLRNDIAKYLKK